MFARFYSIALLGLAGCAPSQIASEPPELTAQMEWTNICKDWDDWDKPALPFRIYGSTYYVGTCGISAILVTDGEGHVLLDSGTEDGAEIVLDNIRALGFDPHDVKWILTSHEHHDHVGGVAALRRATGAQIAALDIARPPLETGKPYPEDPQATSIAPFEGFPVARILRGGEELRIGNTAFTAYSTPAHTPASTSWTWRACEGEACHIIAYADSISTPAAEGYRFSDHPDYIAQVRGGIARVAGLDCDILLTPHPSASGMRARLTGDKPLVEPGACAAYAADALKQFDARLAKETE